jgi:hypothetical protein
MSEPESKSDHILALARDLLDDIELGRLTTEQLLLKVSRLARLTESEEIREWLTYELYGYPASGDVFDKYMKLTGRWVKKEGKRGHIQSLAGIESFIKTSTLELQVMRIPDLSISSANPNQIGMPLAPMTVVNKVIANCNQLHLLINKMTQIHSKVLSLLHKFVCSVYYERVFSGMVQSVFERYKAVVDSKLVGRCGDVLEKFPAVYARLAEDDPEAVSQALATCRRIIDSFADSVFPSSDKTIDSDGNTLKLGEQQVLNRINAYIMERVSSSSRRAKLRQSLGNLYGRTSSGVHAEVSQEEARSLLLNVYLVLGEIISLPEDPSTH